MSNNEWAKEKLATAFDAEYHRLAERLRAQGEKKAA